MDLKKKGFQLPSKVSFEEDTLTDTYGKLVVEPLDRGFGITLGNVLRRVMLSSIEGTAVTGIKLAGALHEFSLLEGVTEDAVNLILNIKSLKFSADGDGPKTATVKVKGPKTVTGADLKMDPSVTIMNPGQLIATVGKGFTFEAELYLEKGKGYVPAEINKERDLPVDVIAVDSVFSPVLKVNSWVEKARVGRETDYDKLLMEVFTDGSVSPVGVVSQASRISTEYLKFFELEEEAVDEPPAAAAPAEETVLQNENLFRSVDELELSVRANNCLKNASIQTIADLVVKTENDMLRTKNFGRKSLNEIKEILGGMGLHLGMRLDPETYSGQAGEGDEA